MKTSRYCFLFDIKDGKGLIFSSANGALGELDNDSFLLVKKFLYGKYYPETDRELELWNALVANEFLVDDDCDEYFILHNNSRRERLKSDTLSLTIAPTMACNFGCTYCFENPSNNRMTPQTEQALISFVKDKLNKYKYIQTTWFGGEPTLYLSLIERLQKTFADLAAQKNVIVQPASIITNGYLLNGALAQWLKDIGIEMAQVTLDGPRETHNKRRPLKNGSETFDRILDNITESYQILNLVIRINIDKQNLYESVKIIEELKNRDILEYTQIHFAQVTADHTACASIQERCFTDREFSEHQAALYKMLFERDIFLFDYPQVFSGGHCGAVSEGSYVISPEGLIFKCWEEISTDPKKAIGSIYNDMQTLQQKTNADKFLNWNPFSMESCNSCDILPICMGGCPVHGIRNNDPSIGACSPFKHNLKDMLLLRYECDKRKEVIL